MITDGEIQKKILSVYTPLSIAISELSRRQKDENLKLQVLDFWGKDYLPKLNGGPPRAVFNRPVISPTLEFRFFLDVAKMIKLKPLLLEYPGKFVTKSIDKYALGRLFFLGPEGKKHGHQLNSLTVVDFNHSEGGSLREVQTVFGVNLVEFHHRLLKDFYPKEDYRPTNFSHWFDSTRERTKYYYLYFFSLFIRNGILFENYLQEDESERNFFHEKVYPSFQELTRIFGVKPLICPLLPLDIEKQISWLSYPDKLKKKIETQYHLR